MHEHGSATSGREHCSQDLLTGSKSLFPMHDEELKTRDPEEVYVSDIDRCGVDVSAE